MALGSAQLLQLLRKLRRTSLRSPRGCCALPICALPSFSSRSGGPHNENRDALSVLLYACCSLHLSPTHKRPLTLTHQQERKHRMHIRQLIQREMLTPVPSPPPPPICCCSLGEEEGDRARAARERQKLGRWGGDSESEREHFDNPENRPDACGLPYSNCFPNRCFVLDRHILRGSEHAAFPQRASERERETQRLSTRLSKEKLTQLFFG